MAAEPLPELAAVHWRPRVDPRRLRRTDLLWTATTLAHVVPFIAAGVALFLVQPLAASVSLAAFAHAWVIPELYAQRGVNVVRPKRSRAPAGALLVRPGGRRVLCYCVGVNDPELPSGDRIAHLLLALRSDERGFATVANLAFSGARWRVRRRLHPTLRPALDAAGRAALDARSTA